MNVLGALLLLTVVSGFLGIAGVGALAFGLFYGARRGVYALKGEPYRPLLGPGKDQEYQHQDVDTGADSVSVKAILKRYQQTSGVGKHARDGLTVLESSERKAANFYSVLDAKFQPGSITWNKFAGAATTAQEAVLRNCAELANDIQVFDHADYKRLEQARRRSTFRSDAQLDSTQEEKYRLFNVRLGEMEALNKSSEKMLLELDKLAAELDRLDDAGASAESERLIAEIRTLIDETKYYKQGLEELDQVVYETQE